MIHVLNPVPRVINQKPNLCAATCLAMEANRRGIKYGFSLEELAYKIGSYIDEEHKEMYMKPLSKRALSGEDPKVGLLYKDFKTTSLRKAIKKIVGLESECHDASKFRGAKEMSDLIISEIKRENGIMMNYWNEPFRGTKDGHYVLVFAFNEETTDIFAADPSPTIPSCWKENFDKFYRTMLPIWKEPDGKSRERGIVVFSGPIYRKKDDPAEVDKFLRNIGRYDPKYVSSVEKVEIKTP